MRGNSKSRQAGCRMAAVVALIGGVITAGCAPDSTGVPGTVQAQLAFAATASESADAAPRAITPVTVGDHTLDLTDIAITVVRAELKRAAADSCAGDDGRGDDSGADADDRHGGDGHGDAPGGSCGELKVAPGTVELPLSGSVVTVPAGAIPAGTFRELELRISQVALRGTFDGHTFDVSIPVVARSEIEFATPLVVTNGTPTSVTVNVPVGSWLVNADGTLIDPNRILASPSLLSLVRARINASLRAFEDRDHDGRDDRGSRHGPG